MRCECDLVNGREAGRSGMGRGRGVVAVVWLALAAPVALAQAFQSYGLNFVTVGDAGNRGATAQEAPLWPSYAPPLGAVNHTFGIMRTNVTNNQWVEFVRAYAPYWAGTPGQFALTGPGIFYTGTVGGIRQYEVGTGQKNFSATASWRVMARFANWLHNDKSVDPAAFENGAYDTSTFGEVSVGGTTMLTDQFTHNEPAHLRWTPTIDRLRPVDGRFTGWSRDRTSGRTRLSSGKGRSRWC